MAGDARAQAPIKATIGGVVAPFVVPSYVTLTPTGSVEPVSVPLKALDGATLTAMIDAWAAAVRAKAGRS